jgi:alpha-D-xyloside xylohydrolase
MVRSCGSRFAAVALFAAAFHGCSEGTSTPSSEDAPAAAGASAAPAAEPAAGANGVAETSSPSDREGTVAPVGLLTGAAGSEAGTSPNPATDESTPALVCPPPPPQSDGYSVDATGVTFRSSSGLMKLHVAKEDIIRVQFTTASTFPEKVSLSVNNPWTTPTPFCVSEEAGTVTITTSRMKAKVNALTGTIAYTDLSDQVVLSENDKSLAPATVEGVATNSVETRFDSPVDEGLFGLGQHQGGFMNFKGRNQHILNTNTQINVPMLVSSRGYGIFWDNYSTSDFYGGEANGTQYRYVSEAGDMVDYYFYYGPSIDHVIALYRVATGAAPLFPKWAYGLFQSKDHYASTAELIDVRDSYRNNGIPLDVIVQDWDYWQPYAWGSHLMDEARYPDPAALVTQMHDANVHLMISIWPLYQQVNPPRAPDELDNFNALNAIDALLPTSGTHHFYDPFNATARTLVYQQIYDRLIGKYGWDAIWADNTEPQAYPDPVNVHAADTALGKGALNINAYPLQHSRALYEGWRSVGPSGKRVYNLTRSAFAGQQRFAAACWSGDINCDFATYTRQVPAGLNYALSGMPYWTTDIGGYFGGGVNWSTPANNELFTRWFQFGAFCPMFRIHGQGARELYNDVWSANTKANLLSIDQLRYRLMPYIYALAGRVTQDGYTIMRHLVFDYQDDPTVYDIGDQFMFGPAMLVNPVTAAGATSRSVYLPAGTWYDFWTGSTLTGGNRMTVDAPLNLIPLFVRAGSIIPMGPMIEYATQSADPLEIRVYTGQNAAFTLYEDAGDTYDYELGQYSQIRLTWNESDKTLTIGEREGSYAGMPTSRTFNIVFVGENHGTGVGVVATADRVVNYDGTAAVVTAN